MFKRKLTALDYVHPEKININDELGIRALVLWLEDQKIRHYKIEDRENLRNIDSPRWKDSFKKYLKDLGSPFIESPLVEQIEWLIGYAVKMEYSDNVDRYVNMTSENLQKQVKSGPTVVSSNPLDNLDFESNEFKNGVETLARIMNVTSHPDVLVTLEAVSKVISKRLNEEVIKKPNEYIPQGKAFPVLEADLGFDLGNKMSNQAARILRLLYIQDLRDLQTKINECIVAVQKVTANPKTDTKIGKVGF